MQAPTVPTVPTLAPKLPGSFGPANGSAVARPAVQIRPLARVDLIAGLTPLVHRAHRRHPLGLP